MLSLESARQQILARLKPLPIRRVALACAHGRFLAESLRAPISLPPFDNSAMDGYALRASDVATATAEKPVVLRLSGAASAGDAAASPVEPGTCSRVFTGAPLPPGADAVVMQEDTRPGEGGFIAVLDGVRPWENVRFLGEDVRAGSALLAEGDRLTASRVGLLAATGVAEVNVRARPHVALIATGNELVETGPLTPGKIYESNRAMLAPLLQHSGVETKVFPLTPDTLTDTKKNLALAWQDCDAVITSGGVSVGDYDFVKPAIEALGGRVDLWRVAIKPGKPFVFGQCGDKYLFGLPGNPVSALATFHLLVRPALLHWQGATQTDPVRYPVAAGESLANHGDRRHFVRAILDETGRVRLAGPQASHLLASLAAANGLVDLPPATTIHPGEPVLFYPLAD
jgi:molybdopterin molybdotransferase